MDPYRLVFDKLLAAGQPDAQVRERIYAECRALVAAVGSDEQAHENTMDALEKVIRRQEMQALYEERLNGG